MYDPFATPVPPGQIQTMGAPGAPPAGPRPGSMNAAMPGHMDRRLDRRFGGQVPSALSSVIDAMGGFTRDNRRDMRGLGLDWKSLQSMDPAAFTAPSDTWLQSLEDWRGAMPQQGAMNGMDYRQAVGDWRGTLPLQGAPDWFSQMYSPQPVNPVSPAHDQFAARIGQQGWRAGPVGA